MELRVHRSLGGGGGSTTEDGCTDSPCPCSGALDSQEFRSSSIAEDEAQTALPRVQEGVEDRADWDLWNSSNSGA